MPHELTRLDNLLPLDQMIEEFKKHLDAQLAAIQSAGTYKRERVIITPQGTTIRVADGKPVLNLCANNYPGLAQHSAVAAATKVPVLRVDQPMAGKAVQTGHRRGTGLGRD